MAATTARTNATRKTASARSSSPSRMVAYTGSAFLFHAGQGGLDVGEGGFDVELPLPLEAGYVMHGRQPLVFFVGHIVVVSWAGGPVEECSDVVTPHVHVPGAGEPAGEFGLPGPRAGGVAFRAGVVGLAE